MREIVRLALFEWRQVDVRVVFNGLTACILCALVFYLLTSAEAGINIVKGFLDFGFLLTTTIWIGMVHEKGFMLMELPPSTWSSPFYSYARRLPISEKQLFRSRVLVKGVQAPVIVVIGICLMEIFQPILPFSFSDASFYSFLALWASIAFISTSTALDEIGVRYQKRIHLYGQAYLYILLLVLFYLVVWVWFIPFDDTFMMFSVYLAEKFPFLSFGIAILIGIVTFITVLFLGDKRINRKGKMA
ncbi:hypothetical protein [Bacillus piscicola]|uniref:hypothetical protein n=1 Tax=Bacillus piscicola TaxID=1632684 RepID=UPI001F08DFE1|nr:hypothetical protein [Bacillus piscicola]